MLQTFLLFFIPIPPCSNWEYFKVAVAHITSDPSLLCRAGLCAAGHWAVSLISAHELAVETHYHVVVGKKKKKNSGNCHMSPFAGWRGNKIIPTGQPLFYCEPPLWKEYDKLILVSQFSNCWRGMPSPLPLANQDLYQNGLGRFFKLHHLHSLVRPCALHKGASWSHQKYSNFGSVTYEYVT